MRHLWQLEWKKHRNYTPFQVLIWIYLIALPALLLSLKSIDKVPKELLSKEIFFIFPTVWQYLGYIGNWLCFFIFGFLAVLFVTNEVNNKTLRQNIITGLNRKEYFLGKVLFMLSLSLFATAYFLAIGFIVGYFNTEAIYWSKVWQESNLIPRYFLMCFSYMVIGFTFGNFVRKTGLALFLFFAYAFFIEKIFRYLVHFRIIKGKSMHYYPINGTSDLVPLNTPFNGMAEGFLEQNDFSFFLNPTEAIISTSIYIVVLLGVSYIYFLRKDL